MELNVQLNEMRNKNTHTDEPLVFNYISSVSAHWVCCAFALGCAASSWPPAPLVNEYCYEPKSRLGIATQCPAPPLWQQR